MEKKGILKAIEELKGNKRNFNQTFEVIINLKGVDLKKTPIDFFINYPHKVKQKKICALVGSELIDDAKKNCDMAIPHEDFEEYKDKKKAKKLVKDYDFFIAQANLMAQVAAAFGRTLGPKGKMPNPKAGCVVGPKANLKPVYEKLQTTLKVSAKQPAIHCAVGKQDFESEKIAENILSVYDAVIHNLPSEKNNVKNVLLKLSMSKPVTLE